MSNVETWTNGYPIKLYTRDGLSLPLKAWSERLNIPYNTMRMRAAKSDDPAVVLAPPLVRRPRQDEHTRLSLHVMRALEPIIAKLGPDFLTPLLAYLQRRRAGATPEAAELMLRRWLKERKAVVPSKARP